MGEELVLFLLGLAGGGTLSAARHRLIRSAAAGYVATAALLGEAVQPLREEWRSGVEEACRRREEAAGRAGKSTARARAAEQQGAELLKEALVSVEKAAVEAAALL